MEVWVKENGERDYYNTPYIEESETALSVYPYSPYHGFHYGLYDKAQPSCGLWTDLVRQYRCTCPKCSKSFNTTPCPPFTTVRGKSSYKGCGC